MAKMRRMAMMSQRKKVPLPVFKWSTTMNVSLPFVCLQNQVWNTTKKLKVSVAMQVFFTTENKESNYQFLFCYYQQWNSKLLVYKMYISVLISFSIDIYHLKSNISTRLPDTLYWFDYVATIGLQSRKGY